MVRDSEAASFRFLVHRLNVYTITLSPLRERTEDLPLLVTHFRGRFNRELGKDVQGMAPDALELLRRYLWPGNLRELQSVLKQAILQATGPVLLSEFLPAVVGLAGKGASPGASPPLALADLGRFIEERLQAGSDDLYAEWLAVTERHLFAHVLGHTGNNLARAARILGINRATLRYRLAALGMTTGPAFPNPNPRPD